MLRKAHDMLGFQMRATDGDIGSVDDFYFDDNHWRLRYFVVNTGSWLFGRRVLIAPQAIEAPLWEEEVLPVHLTKEMVENSPDVDLDKPVTEQMHSQLYEHYGWTDLWTRPGVYVYPGGGTGVMAPPQPAGVAVLERPAPESAVKRADPHLRSIQEVLGYHIAATDGDIGHVEDFFVDEADWTIRYMLVDTRNWLPGRKVLVSPSWINRVDWNDSKIHVNVPKKRIEESPEYDPSEQIGRGYESHLYEYYGLPGYWI
jgi:uncharacterized protein YrrD